MNNKKNPAHFCICGKFLGFRGFCSKKCHDEYYEKGEIKMTSQQVPECSECKSSKDVIIITPSYKNYHFRGWFCLKCNVLVSMDFWYKKEMK